MFKVILDPEIGQGLRVTEKFRSLGAAISFAKLAIKDQGFRGIRVFNSLGKIVVQSDGGKLR